MAGIVSKVLKVAAGVVALMAAYGLGLQAASKDASQEAAGATVEVPRPDMQESDAQVVRSHRDPAAYHATIGERAQDLRSRIAEQAYATLVAESAKPLEASASATTDGSPAPSGDGNHEVDHSQGNDADPYQQIHDAISTSDFFEPGEGQQVPSQFVMPGKAK